MILDGAVDRTPIPVQAEIDQDAAFQKAFDDYAADCQAPGLPAGHRPGQDRRRSTEPGGPVGRQAGGHQRPARAELRRRHHRHHLRPVPPETWKQLSGLAS